MNLDHNVLQLIVIFSFVIIVVLLKSIANVRRAKLWHETARLAIEKGQPLPPAQPQKCGLSRDPRRALLAGLVLIGAGAAACLVLPVQSVRWVGAVPAFIGLAMLLFCFITRGTNGPGAQGPPSGGGLS